MRTATLVPVLLSLWTSAASGGEDYRAYRLPPNVPPVMIAWFMRPEEFDAKGYEAGIDLFARHTGANLLATSIRSWGREVTEDDVYAQIKAMTAYAARHGIRIAMDLDVRLARRAFRRAYPDEQQEMLRLREVPLRASGLIGMRIESTDLRDHYTFRTVHYVPLSGRLVRVYAYRRDKDGIDPKTVTDITERCEVEAATAKEVIVTIPCDQRDGRNTACVMAAFTHLTPAVFAPHLDGFQERIFERYRDSGIVGACKDEWGFPPCHGGCPKKNDYWFSKYRAEAYAERTGGQDLVRDCLLMTFGEKGRRAFRQAAINHFLEMSTLRNGQIEDRFYRAIKRIFEPEAVVATHPTWVPYPGTDEFKKNGLDWWKATRDLAQTDEFTPMSARTSLAKKWGSPVWMNMYYHRKVRDYHRSLWSHALAGGRIDLHPLYPVPKPVPIVEQYKPLLRGGLMRGDCRIRLLNFISDAPLDCPAAVVFGHACAMNWAGPAYDDVGLGVTDGLWRAGYPADLIPSSEIGDPALKISDDGYVQYGPQEYKAVVLYHPEFERPETAAFFTKAAKGKTALFRVGDWTRGFGCKDFRGNAALPRAMTVLPDAEAAVKAVTAKLRKLDVPKQTPATGTLRGPKRGSAAPPTKGRCRLIDGTEILLAGEKDIAGDPISETITVRGRRIAFDAIGVAAARLAADGTLEAMACGGLKRFDGGGVRIALDRRADVAIWRDGAGEWQGVLQDYPGDVPSALRSITKNWLRLGVPEPLP